MTVLANRFVDNNRPVMIRGAALRSPALQRWVNDSDVMAEYGDLRVKLETKKEKVRRTLVPRGCRFDNDNIARPRRMKAPQWWAQKVGWDARLCGHGTRSSSRKIVMWCLNSPCPCRKSVFKATLCLTSTRHHPLGLTVNSTQDVIIPDVLACHDAVNNVLEANLWMSGGSTRSVIHKDADNALNCLVAGKKRWWFISPKWMNRGLPMADEEEAPGEIGGFSRIDVDAVDLKKYRKLRNVDYQYTEALPGDCLLVPWGYPHQV